MKPSELAKLHPHLFHITSAGAGARILERGLLTTRDILVRWELADAERRRLLTTRRAQKVSLDHASLGRITINDNRPVSEKRLATILDDGLTPADWLELLNSRVFFFVSEKPLQKLRDANLNKSDPKDVLKIDNRLFASTYAHQLELVPFNSGSTQQTAPRRGLKTFVPLLQTNYDIWRLQRGNKTPDVIKEIAVCASIPNISDFVVDMKEGLVDD